MREALFNLGASAYDALVGQELWRAQVRRVLDHAPDLGPEPRVLDIGCGPGVSAFVLAEALGPGARITGIDIAEKMIALAERHHREQYPHLDRLEFGVADATRLPYPDASFDLAVGHSFLYLVSDRARVLKELRRVLAPGAVLVLMEPREGGSLLSATARALLAPDTRAAARRDPIASLRFATSMFAWRWFSSAAGRMSPALVERLFREAGFTAIASHETLAGLGLHCVARVL